MGRPIGGCTATVTPAAAALDAVYPLETPEVPHLAVQLGWPDAVQPAAVRTAAGAFVGWLKTQPGKAALLAIGLRPPGYPAGAPLDPGNGAKVEWPFGHPHAVPVPADVMRSVVQRYVQAHRPGRVLVALDTSGSMRTATADGRGTRFSVALDAVQASLGRMGGHDEFGLTLFSTEFGDAGTSTVIPIGPRVPAQDTVLDRIRRQVVPAGDTPLYRAIDAGIRAVRGGPPDRLAALVVLTDGLDTASGGLTPDASGGTAARVFVVAIGEASCGTEKIVQVTRDTGGGCLTASATTVDQTLATLFRLLWERSEP
jgi:hypothetical protein